MLIELDPGLKCKKCASRMKLGEDRRWQMNLVLKQDKELKFHDFEVKLRCMDCMTDHEGIGFIRDGIFRGVYEYKTVTPADDRTELDDKSPEGAKIYDDI